MENGLNALFTQPKTHKLQQQQACGSLLTTSLFRQLVDDKSIASCQQTLTRGKLFVKTCCIHRCFNKSANDKLQQA